MKKKYIQKLINMSMSLYPSSQFPKADLLAVLPMYWPKQANTLNLYPPPDLFTDCFNFHKILTGNPANFRLIQGPQLVHK